MRTLLAAALIAAGAAALWLAFGHGFVNYDTAYALVWGDELAAGQSPDYDAPLPPTPHPLATFGGLVLAPLGDPATGATLALSYFALAAIAYLVFQLGRLWFNPWAGLAAAAIVVTRAPLISAAARSYLDVAFIALVLAALTIETRRRRAGWPVLAVLAAAGLLRPEAWLFSAAYLLYLAFAELGRAPGLRAPIARLLARDRLGLVALAASAPLVWAGFDLAFAGDPLHSLTGTQSTVETLARESGIVDAVRLSPELLEENLKNPTLLAAAVGIVFGLAVLGHRAWPGIAAAGLSVLAFLLLATAGLAVIGRYLLLTAVLLTVFAGAGLAGWVSLHRSDNWRRAWLAAAAISAAALIWFAPADADRIDSERDSVAAQERIEDDLHALVDGADIDRACGPIAVPDTRAIPILALELDRRPSEIGSEAPIERGYAIEAASPRVDAEFVLDRNDPGDLSDRPPPGAQLVAENESWRLLAGCR